ncbi:MAG: acyl-CoA dehydrogenase [Kiloniellales bacterium]|nr:acyl-CoA dehydrogenase [Kiloniellales bacterium]
MSDYNAPLADMRFALEAAAGLSDLTALPAFKAVEPDLVDAILEEAGKLAGEVLAPINASGDRNGCVFENGVVRMPAGFQDAYDRLVAGGWISLPFDPANGGQGLPWTLAMAVQETWHAANMSFGLTPLLTQGAAELLQAHGTETQKATYLGRLIDGTWAGTMNLTEPQAGSDLGAITTSARRDQDNGADAYRITGQKIFITYGEHDLAENIVHMVLARSPDGPPGTRGLSLFIVPKFLPDEDGNPGRRNDLRCVAIEEKLGIHASPTCVMSYGDDEGALGFLLGEENRGLAGMFTMMNNARLAVGTQGLGIAERAYQRALAYARERVQSRAIDDPDGGPSAIIRHPDVRRNLATMKALSEAMRGVIYYTAGQLDRAKSAPEEDDRARSQSRLELMTPIAKAWCTDRGVEVASLGVQVHGGMGFIEPTGAAQHLRDARINPIYEGTNGIQALDLATRKLARDGGAAARELIAEIAASDEALQRSSDPDLKAIGGALGEARFVLDAATDWLVGTLGADPAKAAAVATPYLELFGTVAGGWMLGREALAARARLEAGGDDARFMATKVRTARFYCDNLLPRAAAEAATVMTGADSTLAFAAEDF